MGVNSLCGLVFKTASFTNSNEIITYKDCFKEKRDALYLYADRIIAKSNGDDVSMELESEYLLICKYDKVTNTLSSIQNLLSIKDNVQNIEGFEEGARFTPSNNTSDFIKRYVFYVNQQLFNILNNELSLYSGTYSWSFLAAYIDNLDNVEKLCKTMSVKNVINMMENRSLVFEDARKLKQVIGIPPDIISRLDEMGFGYLLADVQKLRRNEVVTVDEIRYLLDFVQSLHTMSKKRKFASLDGYSLPLFKDILECINYGYQTRAIVNAIAKELMFYSDLTKADVSKTARILRDCIVMTNKMNLERKICQNFGNWHNILSRNFTVFQKPRADEFKNAAININAMYSYRTDEYLIQCPSTERELFNIGCAYHNCLPTYRDRIIDKSAIILSIYRLDEQGAVIDEIPAYTFEINKDLDIIQLKTFFDADVADVEIINVVKNWKTQMKKKG